MVVKYLSLCLVEIDTKEQTVFFPTIYLRTRKASTDFRGTERQIEKSTQVVL
jgi:hypothetical protein